MSSADWEISVRRLAPVGELAYTIISMSVIDEYLDGVNEPDRGIIRQMYGVIRQVVPETTEGLSYGMPTLKYKNKSLVSIISNKNFMSLYPFGSVTKLGVDISSFEQTTGSIHFTPEKQIPEQTLKSIVLARKQQIEDKYK